MIFIVEVLDNRLLDNNILLDLSTTSDVNVCLILRKRLA